MKNFLGSITLLLLFTMSLAYPCQSAAAANYTRSEMKVAVPNVVLIDQDNNKVALKPLLEGSGPMVLDFIYVSCTTLCPILSAGYVNLQDRLGTGKNDIKLVSISIDPENDTPEVMKKHLERYGAQPGWTFLTGSRTDINYVLNAFNAYYADKMWHKPLNFIRAPEEGKWIRIDGIISGKDLVQEIERARKE